MEHDNTVSRRNLIRAAAAVPFTAVPFQAVRGAEANSSVTVGLIGAGGRGSTVAKALVESSGARLTAISELYDDRIEHAKQRIGVQDPKIFKDYRELLASDVDAVIIATPVFLHADHFEDAVKAGKHIYIEKPAAADVAGCKRILQAADSADRRLNIAFGFQRRYGEVYHRAKKRIDSGELGKMQMAHVRFIKHAGRDVPVKPPRTLDEKIQTWHVWRELSGDLIVENNIHLIDVMNWFLGGRPDSAIGSGGRIAKDRPGDMMDHGNVTFRYAEGLSGSLIGTTLGPPGYRDVAEQFFGSDGVVETAAEYWKHFKDGKVVLREESPRNVTIDAMAEFVRRIAEDQPENTGVRGVESTLTAIMGRMAMELERKVSWDEVMRSG